MFFAVVIPPNGDVNFIARPSQNSSTITSTV